MLRLMLPLGISDVSEKLEIKSEKVPLLLSHRTVNLSWAASSD